MDPFVALSFAAAATERIKVGTGVCLVVERDPIVTAKEVASLDLLSGGRFLFGIGAGWNREEMRNHGTNPRRRFTLMRERVEAMKEIWAADEAEYHGEFVDFDPLWAWPKPVQRPHPPILLGGGGPKVLDRVLAYADEWMPNRYGTPEELGERIAELRERAGRHVRVVASGVKPDRELVERLAAVGVDGCTFYVSADADASQAERELDGFAALA
jgi:probable F420-dependent oxidoreductase